MTEQNQQQPSLPEIREVPVWAGNEKLEITGIEFDYLYNFVTGVTNAYAACQSVMQRNLLDGKIRMSFEKLDPETSTYRPMTEEEQQPHLEKFNQLVESIKNPPVPQTPSAEPQEAAEENEGAKIVSLV